MTDRYIKLSDTLRVLGSYSQDEMSDYIKRSDALVAISANTADCNPDHFAMDTEDGRGDWNHASGWNGGIIASRCAVKGVPAADVRENVHGEWETDGCAANGHDDIYCSNYGEDATYFVDSSDGIHWSKIIPNFCPQCGAIMDGGDKR